MPKSHPGCPYLQHQWQWVIAWCLMGPGIIAGLVAGWLVTFGGILPPISECGFGLGCLGVLLFFGGIGESCAFAGALPGMLIFHVVGGPCWLIAQGLRKLRPAS